VPQGTGGPLQVLSTASAGESAKPAHLGRCGS
jgi:hypothetical protein